MKNYGIIHFKNANVDNFTSNLGIKVRRGINRPMRFILKLATKGNIIIECYPTLKKNKPYIFAATHSFVEEVSAILSTIDRSAYSLIGTTNQLENNHRVYANWLTGMIYVDRKNKQSREESMLKMERIINRGSSILMFVEGGWNNTENLLVQKPFSGVYKLSHNNNIEVVPISTFNEFGSKDIYIRVGNPLKLYDYNQKEALIILRDALATGIYEQIESYSTPINRSQLSKNSRLNFMEERRLEYLKTKWTKDVWDEELTRYLDKDDKEYNAVWDSMDNIVVNKDNASIMGPILVKRLEDKKYNFKDYMHRNWNKCNV